ncbi:hypothetical protein SKAU_G00055000 [Synaphobranchus kaupii]|uniref:Uncharacterized protein n=1 Tax=Synaphobranchus kaupii TaxID=118154 RepID=A0A9Q1G3W2_SYNKA|nr:hypothetical protein SKAU_G00055000 [Synaphobranchus kaupii]
MLASPLSLGVDVLTSSKSNLSALTRARSDAIGRDGRANMYSKAFSSPLLLWGAVSAGTGSLNGGCIVRAIRRLRFWFDAFGVCGECVRWRRAGSPPPGARKGPHRPQHSCGRRTGGGAAEHTHLALRMFLSELGLSQWRSPEFCFIMLLLALIWFVRLYLHYCSQWLFLQAIAVPVNKFRFHPHTVELVYQNSLLHTREELAMVVVGPLTLNAATLLLVLIRWGCQLIFSSFPSFLSKFIMALGVWTVLDPLAVFAVDAILGRLASSAEQPTADAAKLYWLFHRTEHSGMPGILITLFLYAVLFLFSVTILYIYFLRLHNDGRMLDIFQRLHCKEEAFFIPHDMELSNQELSYIVKKAEQWRGFNGERRKILGAFRRGTRNVKQEEQIGLSANE